MRLTPILAAAITAFSTTSLDAKVARTTLEELATISQLIVIGRDDAIELTGRWAIARFQVEEVLKGETSSDLLYLATPTWTCDIATARQGQRSLLFLSAPDSEMSVRPRPPSHHAGQPVFRITWSGRGRLPIDEVDGTTYVTVWTADIAVPSDLPLIDGPEPRFDFIQRAPIDLFRDAIELSLRP